jgi:hypothetical protein
MHQCKNCGTGDVREVKCMEFTAPVITRQMFERIGLFDERFSLGSGVDFDFCYRARAAGIKIYCDDGSSFIHLVHRSIEKAGTLSSYASRANIEMNRGMTQKYGITWKKIIEQILDINKKTNTMKRVAVYTTIFGGYDQLKAMPKQSMKADYFLINDQPVMFNEIMEDQENWKVIQVTSPRKDLHPRMRAKWYKVFPWEIEELRNYEVVIFIDGSIQVTSPDFISYCVASLKSDIALFRHPERSCIYDELKASLPMVKYEGETMAAQIESYKKFHPAGFGLFACGIIVRKNTDRIRSLMMSWWHEIIKFTWQDQLSFPVVCRLHHIQPDILPGSIVKNDHFKIMRHADKADQALVQDAAQCRAMPRDAAEPTKAEVMNEIIYQLGYKRYLEIGLRTGETFDAIKCEKKSSVDPVALPGHVPTHQMTSDEFFAAWHDIKFDMIFIDGDHSHEQVKKDFVNAFKLLTEGGCIVMHDTNPINERFIHPHSCGTAYRVLVDIFLTEDFPYEWYTLTMPQDEGNGISIVFRGKITKRTPYLINSDESIHPQYGFKEFDKNRGEIAHLVELDQLKKIVEAKSNKNTAKK